MSDCVGAPRMPVCRENYPFVCSTIKSPDNVPIEFAIENGASVRIVFLNYQSQKHKHQRSRSRQHVFTALLDNVRDHRAGTSDHPFQKHAQVRLRVHHIVIPRYLSLFRWPGAGTCLIGDIRHCLGHRIQGSVFHLAGQ